MSKTGNSLAEIQKFLQESDHFLVVAHVNPDGDAIGSTLAMRGILRQLGKSYTLVNESYVPERFRFLPGSNEIRLLHDLSGRQFSHVITLDCGDRLRVGDVAELYAPGVKICNIDHHSTNDLFGVANYVDIEAAATVELLYRLVEYLELEFTLEIATCIYTGLMTDTGSFKYPNTTPEVLRQAARLLEIGVPGAQIADRVLMTNTFAQLKILQKALETLQLSPSKKVAWLQVSRQDLQDCEATEDDLEGIVNYARGIEGVEVGIMFRETRDRKVKASLRSRSELDVAKIAQQFHGGGHARAAGCTLDEPLAEAASRVVKVVENAWEDRSK
ncbi:DHH family phosphoesterase [Risungbinella massiliensis]|uniref:DHH family phosphoesterase n=1 Tax=Risungbinella massiliensis TaxID=1329796 RepID=UPI0005CB99C6|nr:bifunctional oligoribonuclease/PAP phosphatase NrnA [Risungbinella massiliensis]